MGWFSPGDIFNNVIADLLWFVVAYWLAEKIRVRHYLSFPGVLLIGVVAFGALLFLWNQAKPLLWDNDGYDRSISARSSREGPERGFEEASRIWFASIAGARIAQLPAGTHKKIERVLLIEPNSETMKELVKVQGDRGEDFPESVRQAVKFCKGEEVKKKRGGTEIPVRLSSALLLNVTFFDPETPQAWARVQEFIPHFRGQDSLVYAIRKKEWPELYDRIESSFIQNWNSGRDPKEITVGEQ